MTTVASNGIGLGFVGGTFDGAAEERSNGRVGVVVGCPALGLAGDRSSYSIVPCPEHVCYAEGDSRSTPTAFQEQYCLSGHHEACPVWQGKAHLGEGDVGRLPERPHLSGLLSSLPARVAVGVVLLAFAGAGSVFAVRSSAAGSGARASARRTNAPIAAPAAVAPVAPPDVLPTLRAIGNSLTAALTKPRFQTYTVQSGDSLTNVAARFNTTVAALALLNKLSSTAKLTIGQAMIVPTVPVPVPTAAH